jgi:hypothetical protein
MDDKLAVPAAGVLPESEAATIAATSLAGDVDEKASVVDSPSDVETTTPNNATPSAQPEKATELARHATAASKTGESIVHTQTREDGTEYPTGMKLGLINLALCLSVFLMALGR